MRGDERTIFLFCLVRRIAIAFIVLVFLACSVCAQDLRQRQQECEKLFSAALAAEQRNDPINAELRYQECRELAQKYRLPKMEAAALHRLAVIKARNKRFSESANLFRRAIELDPQNALILCDFAQLYADRKDFKEAEIIFKNALSIDPNNPKVLYGLGVVIATQRGERHVEGGERHVEGLRYLKLAVGEAEAYKELARIYRSQGDIRRAEFAEQRAKLAGEQRDTTRVLASDSASPSARSPQRETHPPQTPPEVASRIRKELVEVERREIAEPLRNPATDPATPPTAQPPVTRTPLIPIPMHPAIPTVTATPSAAATASPRETFPLVSPTIVSPGPTTQATAVMTPQPQPATGPPVDPFATVAQQQQSPISPVRRLDSPPVVASSPSSAVRTILSQTKPDSPTPSLVPGKTDMLVSNQTTESKATESKATNAELPLVKIASSFPSEQRLPQRTLTSVGPTRQDDSSPVRALSGGNERTERTQTVNPLRPIPADRADLIAPGADTSLIAALPSYSAVGVTTRIPRIDINHLPEQSNNTPNTSTPNTTEQQPHRIIALRGLETTRETETARETTRPLPVRNADTLQSPSAVIARREAPAAVPKETSFFVADVRSQPSSARMVPRTTPKQDNARIDNVRIAPSDRRFSAATAPDVFSFAPARKEPPPNVHSLEPVEVATRPLETGTPLLIAAVPTPETVFADPFSVINDPKLAEAKRGELPMSPIVESVVPFPVASNLPRVDETRPTPTVTSPPPARELAVRPLPAREASIEPFAVASNPPTVTEARPTPTVTSPPPVRELAVRPLPAREASTEPFAVASNPPTVTEARPAPTVTSPPPARELAVQPLPAREAPAEPFAVASNLPRVTETRPTPTVLPPVPTREEPVTPFPVASNLHETRPAPAVASPPPAREIAAQPLPARETPATPFAVASNPPTVTETRPTPTVLSPVPAREEPVVPFPVASNLHETRPAPAVALPPPAREIAAQPLPAREVPAVPFAAASNPPRVTETRPTPVVTSPVPAREEPVVPFPVAGNLHETRPAPAVSSPPPAREIAAAPFAVASNPPRVTETRPVPAVASPPPAREIAAGSLPGLEEFAAPFAVASNLPRATETRTAPNPLLAPAAREVAARPQPAREEPTGFASSRRTGTRQEVNVPENNGSTGFARSRR